LGREAGRRGKRRGKERVGKKERGGSKGR